MTRPIFVSHASEDSELVERLIMLLKVGAGLTDEDYTCPAVPGGRIDAGTGWLEEIRRELAAAELVIQIISPEYLASTYCMQESGAVWGSQQARFPILVPPVQRDALDGVLGVVQAPYLDEGVDELAPRIAKLLGRSFDNAKWQTSKARFSRLLFSADAEAGAPPLSAALIPRLLRDVRGVEPTPSRQSVPAEDRLDYLADSLQMLLPHFSDEFAGASNPTAIDHLESTALTMLCRMPGKARLRVCAWYLGSDGFTPGRVRAGWHGPVRSLSDDAVDLARDMISKFERIWTSDVVSDDPGIAPLARHDGDYVSFAALPIIAGQSCFGFVHIEAPRPCPLSLDDVRLAESIVGVFAAALVHAKSRVPTDADVFHGA